MLKKASPPSGAGAQKKRRPSDGDASGFLRSPVAAHGDAVQQEVERVFVEFFTEGYLVNAVFEGWAPDVLGRWEGIVEAFA